MGDDAQDERLDFVFRQVQATYKNVNMEKFDIFCSADATLNAVYEVGYPCKRAGGIRERAHMFNVNRR